jgi:hypothetical protein
LTELYLRLLFILMGASYDFKCAKCGYCEEISGEADCGMVFSTKPGICKDCNRLIDIIDRYQEWYLEKYPELRSSINVCPHCKGAHIELIDDLYCPRCGGPMEKGDLAAFWD